MCDTGSARSTAAALTVADRQKGGGRGCSQEVGLKAWVIGSQPGMELHTPSLSIEPGCQVHAKCQTSAAPTPTTLHLSTKQATTPLRLSYHRRAAPLQKSARGTWRVGLLGAHRHAHLRLLLHLRELVAGKNVKEHPDWVVSKARRAITPKVEIVTTLI